MSGSWTVHLALSWPQLLESTYSWSSHIHATRSNSRTNIVSEAHSERLGIFRRIQNTQSAHWIHNKTHCISPTCTSQTETSEALSPE